MRTRVPVIAAMCAVLVLAASSPASAEVTGGPCQYMGHWRLTVGAYDATHLRVVFAIRGQDPGSIWQLFGSDNGIAFVPKTKTADPTGVVRVRWRPLDRAGADAVSAAGSATGNSCSGALSF